MVLRGERKGIEKKFYDLSEKIVNENGLSVYDMDYLPGSQELRLFIIDKSTGTAVISDCIKVDKAFDPFVENEEDYSWMPEALVLEVSSPGMFRNLKTLEHFESAVGENILLSLKSRMTEDNFPGLPKKINNEKKVKVKLISHDETELLLSYEEFEFKLNFIDIKKANLEPDY